MTRQQGQPSSKKTNPQPGVHAPEIKEALNARAMYRTMLVVAGVFLLLACLAVISSASGSHTETDYRPRAIVLVVPYLQYDTLEVAMSSNKSPFLGMISASNGVYARIHTKNADLEASLVTLLTGETNSTAKDLNGSTSFLRILRKANKKPVLLASSGYWLSDEEVGNNCTHVGLYDTECPRTNCSIGGISSYCNAVKKLVSCDNKAQIYREDLLDAFQYLIKSDGDILYAHTEVTSSNSLTPTNEDRLAALSDLSVMDGTLGKMILAANERSRKNRESWLIMLVGAGGDGLERVPLFMAAYAKGNLLRFGPIPENATLADISPTVLNWFDIVSENDMDRVRGMCSTGVVLRNCETTANWP